MGCCQCYPIDVLCLNGHKMQKLNANVTAATDQGGETTQGGPIQCYICNKDISTSFGYYHCLECRSSLCLECSGYPAEVISEVSMDPIDILKQSMPISFIDIRVWVEKVNDISKNFFKVDELVKRFDSQLFTKGDHWDPDARFCKLLLNLPGNYNGSIARMSAISLGLLWCRGSPCVKAEVMFDTLVGAQAGQAINSEDHELNKMFDTIVEIAVVSLPDAN